MNMSEFIATADWHLRPDRPRCRLDENWDETQNKMMDEIVSLSRKWKCPILIVGDLNDTAYVPPYVIRTFFERVVSKARVGLLPGNHDLPYHSMKNMMESSYGILWTIAHLWGFTNLRPISDFGDWVEIGKDDAEKGDGDEEILFIHRLTFPNIRQIPPNVKACTAADLLKTYPHKWIITGDMHQAFHVEKNGRHVINPGCVLRQEADEKDYKPSVYHVDTKKGKVEKVFLHDDATMVTDAYLRDEEAKNERISAFVQRVRMGGEVDLDFVKNVERAMKKTKLDPGVVDEIRALMEDNAEGD